MVIISRSDERNECGNVLASQTACWAGAFDFAMVESRPEKRVRCGVEQRREGQTERQRNEISFDLRVSSTTTKVNGRGVISDLETPP